MSFTPQPFPGHQGEAPVSKTMQYKKITKPLLERKRRARINACLDELKDIMTGALQVGSQPQIVMAPSSYSSAL